VNCSDIMGPLELLSLGDLLHSPEVHAVLDVYDEPLKALFVAYCTIDARSCPRWDAAVSTGHGYGMGFVQLWELMKDFELACCREGVQPQLSRSQIAFIFLSANRVGLAADDKMEVVGFDEFKEILTRVAAFFVPDILRRMKGDETMNLDEEARQEIDTQEMCTALQAVLTRMDASPGMMKITLHYGGTHTGKLRLVQDPTRRPHGWQEEVLKEESRRARTSTPALYTREGVRALHDEAYPHDGTQPHYVTASLKQTQGSPPWRCSDEEAIAMEAYAYSPEKFASSPGDEAKHADGDA